MNKLFTTLLIGMFLLSLTSVSAFDWDNVETIYGENPNTGYPSIEIKNLFGLGETLFDGHLTEHTSICGEDCSSKLEFEHSGGVLIDDIKFLTEQEDDSWNKQDVRSYRFKYEAELPEYETQCTDLVEVCIEGDEFNNFVESCYTPLSCEQIQTGTYTGWKTYTVGEELPKGHYEMFLEAEKKPSRTVDWIIKIQGQWLDDWAIWGSVDINEGLTNHWTFNDNLNDSIGTNEGTLVINTEGYFPLNGNANDSSINENNGFYNPYIQFHDLDSVVNITMSYGTATLDTTNFIEGDAGVSITKTDTAHDSVNLYTTYLETQNVENRTVIIPMYFKDQATIDKLHYSYLWFVIGQEWGQHYSYWLTNTASLDVGWNYLEINLSDSDGSMGSPDLTLAAHYSIIMFTNQNSDIMSVGDLVIDDIHFNGPHISEGRFDDAEGSISFLTEDLTVGVTIENLETIFNGSNDYTVSLWVKPNTSGFPTSIWNFRGGAENQYSLTNMDGSFMYDTKTSVGSDSIKATDVELGNWTNIICTSLSGEPRMYIDGVNTDDGIGLSNLGAGNSVFVLGSPETSPLVLAPFNGSIDELIILDEGLDSDEVAALYESSSKYNLNDIYVEGKINNATNLLKDLVYVDTNSSIVMDHENSSITFWINITDEIKAEGTMIMSNSSDISNVNYISLYDGNSILALEPTTNYKLLYWEAPVWHTPSAPLSNGWHHFALTLSSGGVPKLYVDNVDFGSPAVMGGEPVVFDDISLRYISSRQDEFSVVNNNLDDLRIYERTLSTEDIELIYNSGSGTEDSSSGVITLNSPTDGSMDFDSNVTFNVTSEINTGVNITQMSLWTNITGTWALNETTTFRQKYGDFYDDFDASMKTSMTAYFKLEDVPLSNVEDTHNAYDFTDTYSLSYQRIGVENYGINFTQGSTDRACRNGLGITSDLFSSSLWIKFTPNAEGVFMTGDGGPPISATVYTFWSISSTNYITFYNHNSGDSGASSDNPINDDEWYHIATVANGSKVTLYINGVAQTNTADAWDPGYVTHWCLGSGRAQIKTAGFLMDEVAFWSRNITQTEIDILYNPNEYLNESITQTWNKTISADTTWNVEVCDTDDECGFSQANYTILLDADAPVYQTDELLTPIIYNYGDNISIKVKPYDNSGIIDTCWYGYNNTNTTFECEYMVEQTINITSAVEAGLETTDFYFYANDTLGNEGSFYDSIAYDTTAPTTNINHQTPIVYNYGDNVSVNFTVSDINLDVCKIDYPSKYRSFISIPNNTVAPMRYYNLSTNTFVDWHSYDILISSNGENPSHGELLHPGNFHVSSSSIPFCTFDNPSELVVIWTTPNKYFCIWNDTEQYILVLKENFNEVTNELSRDYFVEEYTANEISCTSDIEVEINLSTVDYFEEINLFTIDVLNNYNQASTSFEFDSTLPTITPESFVHGEVGYEGENETINVTSTDVNLDSCWYDYNGTNITIAGCTTGVKESISINVEYMNYNVTFYSNDTIGNLNSETLTWDYILFEASQTYDATTTETDLETYEIVVGYNTSIWSAYSANLVFVADTTAGTVTPTSTQLAATASRQIPAESAATNLTFYWEFDLTNSTGTYSFPSSIQTQEVSRVNFELCNYSEGPQLLFQVYSTNDPTTSVNATIASAWTLKTHDGDVALSRSFEDTNENVSSWGFCISPNTTTYTVSVDLTVDAANYTPTTHFIVDTDYVGNTENISLFMLHDDDSTLTELKVTDQDNVPVENVYITIQRYDLGTDTYYDVAQVRTDSLGSDLAYIEWYNDWYKFVGVLEGDIVFTDGPKKVSSSPLVFKTEESTSLHYEKYGDISYSLVYINSSENFVLTYVDPSGLTTTNCLRVFKRNATKDYSICETCQAATSGTIYCNTADWGNGTFIAQYYASGSPDYWIDVLYEWKNTKAIIYDELGNSNATGLAILLAGIVLSLFLVSPALGVLGAILGIALTSALGFQPLDAVTFGGIVVVGALIMWAVQK